jgi:hypothetical protein
MEDQSFLEENYAECMSDIPSDCEDIGDFSDIETDSFAPLRTRPRTTYFASDSEDLRRERTSYLKDYQE